jgi:hypothetical protein
MLFKQSDLAVNSIQEAVNILNESVYLTEDESLASPVAIPVVENARIGACVVAFDDVKRLAEDYGVDYIDAMQAIAESNQIDMEHLAVSVPEYEIIAYPSIVNELSNVVVAPLSSKDAVSELCEMCVQLAIDESDAGYIDAFANEFASLNEEILGPDGKPIGGSSTPSGGNGNNKEGGGLWDKAKGAASTVKEKIMWLLSKIKHYGYDTPKKYIGKALEALKTKYLQLKQWAATKNDKGEIPWYKKVVGMIMSAIDKLTNLLGNAKDAVKNAANTQNDLIKTN